MPYPLDATHQSAHKPRRKPHSRVRPGHACFTDDDIYADLFYGRGECAGSSTPAPRRLAASKGNQMGVL